MSQPSQPSQPNQQHSSNNAKPQQKKMMHLWMVEDYPATASKPERKSFWTKIGVAFENKDGSYSIELSAIPVSGRLQMRKPSPRDERPTDDASAEATVLQ